MISTIRYNQHELLQDILKLHVKAETFHCDPTYGKGNFYTGTPKIFIPQLVSDISPKFDFVVERDCRGLYFQDNSINSIIFDPPFVCGHRKKGKEGIMKARYGSFKYIKDLWQFYGDSMTEFKRVLRPDGWLVFKCQDTVQDHKNYFSHVKVMNMAIEREFYPKDFLVLLAKHRLPRHNQKNQEHARKYHSYFWVFQNRKSRVQY